VAGMSRRGSGRSEVVKTSTQHVRRYRQRKKQGVLLLPRIEVTAEMVDALVEAHLLQAWDESDPAAVAAAVVKLLRTLSRNAIP
jgi:hypothetical protein